MGALFGQVLTDTPTNNCQADTNAISLYTSALSCSRPIGFASSDNPQNAAEGLNDEERGIAQPTVWSAYYCRRDVGETKRHRAGKNPSLMMWMALGDGEAA